MVRLHRQLRRAHGWGAPLTRQAPAASGGWVGAPPGTTRAGHAGSQPPASLLHSGPNDTPPPGRPRGPGLHPPLPGRPEAPLGLGPLETARPAPAEVLWEPRRQPAATEAPRSPLPSSRNLRPGQQELLSWVAAPLASRWLRHNGTLSSQHGSNAQWPSQSGSFKQTGRWLRHVTEHVG